MVEKKNYNYNLDDIGLYDEAEEMEKMMNSLKEEGEMLGEKKGANNEKKSIAKSMLAKKMDIPLISDITGLSEAQIARLM